MYVCFIFSFTELTTSITQAGGPFAHSKWAFGPAGGYLAGAATLIAFVFAWPAILLLIGDLVNVQFRRWTRRLLPWTRMGCSWR